MLTLCLPSKLACQNKPFQSLANKIKTTTKTLNYSNIHMHNFSSTSASGNSYPQETRVVDDEFVEHHQILTAAGLEPGMMPMHLALFPDGSRRWARKRGLSAVESQAFAFDKAKEITNMCVKYGIKVLTWFAFSTENWVRAEDEIENAKKLFIERSMTDVGWLLSSNIRCSIIGDRSVLPKSMQAITTLAENSTKNNTGLHLIIALNYGGRYDITQACKNVAMKVKDGVLELEDIDESIVEQELETRCTEFSSPDLFIRTSGMYRISNFMLWQMSYTEMFFAEKLFPDYGEDDFVDALKWFQKRNRRRYRGGRTKSVTRGELGERATSGPRKYEDPISIIRRWLRARLFSI